MNEKEIENLFEQEIANHPYHEMRDVVAYLYRVLLDEKTKISVPSQGCNQFDIYNSDFDFSFKVGESNICIYKNEEGKRKGAGTFKIKDTLFEKLNLTCPYLLARRDDSEDVQVIRKHRVLFDEIKEKLNDIKDDENRKATLEKAKNEIFEK